MLFLGRLGLGVVVVVRLDLDIAEGEGVALAVVAGVGLLELGVGVGEGGGGGLERLGGQRVVEIGAAHQLHRDAGAVVGGHHLVGAAVAVGLGGLVDPREAGVDRGGLALVKRDAVGSGVIEQGLALEHLVLGGAQEVILPGPLGEGAVLLIQALEAVGGIQAEHGGIAAVLVGKRVVLIGVVVADLGGGVVPVADGVRRAPVHQRGVEEQDQRDQHHHGDGADGPAALASGLFLRLFFEGEHFLVGAGLAGGLTVFPFGRCTHDWLSLPLRSYSLSCNACRLGYYNAIGRAIQAQSSAKRYFFKENA